MEEIIYVPKQEASDKYIKMPLYRLDEAIYMTKCDGKTLWYDDKLPVSVLGVLCEGLIENMFYEVDTSKYEILNNTGE